MLSRRDFLKATAAGLGAAILGPRAAFGATAVPQFAFSAETQAFFDRLLPPPDDSRAGYYDDLINALVASGVWDRLDGLWVYAAEDGGTALTNLVSPKFRATEKITAGAPTFVKDKGWTGFGVNANIHTGFTPLVSEGHFAQNDACMFCWSLTANQVRQFLIGAGQSVTLCPNWQDGTASFALNSAKEDSVRLGADTSGFWLVNRTAANAITLDHNGSVVASASTPSVAHKEEGPFIAPSGAYQGALCGIGGGLTNGQRVALHKACQTYLHAIGAI